MKNSATNDPPLIIDRELYEALLKDPLYGHRAQIGVEIGRIIIKDTPEEAIKDIPTNLPEGSCSSDQPKKGSGADSSKGNARTPPGGSGVPRLVYCENCGTASMHGAKFCYVCGNLLRGDTDTMREITLETLIEVMHEDPIAGIVWCHWVYDRQAKLAPSPLLEKYLDAHEKGLYPPKSSGIVRE
ncbi:zinc ribbon domain-containing protein [Methanoculleus bourgensis]|jgi:hypothetical protein|uniref:Zinc ribbon domain-containing protein n=1 Tax=Methanoculleus bourgensis TaxID=83986 RepID=A0A0X3BQD8_9EURY|nr:zinc ribbon domain-containing protein [Methanoculleus bourgensis]CVK33754.1 protein of unknown function [Methanoculleus bourgensis]